MTTPGAPKPTQEEKNLQFQQATLLGQQRASLERDLRNQELLQPLLLQQQGIRPILGTVQTTRTITAPAGQLFGGYDAQGNMTFLPDTPKNRTRVGVSKTREEPVTEQQITGYEDIYGAEREAQRARQVELDTLNLALAKQQGELSDLQLGQTREALRLQQALLPELIRSQGYEPQFDAQGQLIGATAGEGLTEQRRIEDAFRERSLAALEGRLPVNPALLSDLALQEENLRESLRRQLGTGYETSTPGIETLGDFAKRRTEILEGARRGDLTLAEQLGLARGEYGRGGTASTLGTLRAVSGGALGAGDVTSPFGGGGTTLAQVLGQLGRGTNVGQVLGGLSGLQQQLAAERDQRYRGQLAQQQGRTNLYSSIGSLLGGAAGLYFGGPAGAAAGAALGGGAATGLSYI